MEPTGLDIPTGNLSSDKVQPKTFYAIDDGTWYMSTDGGVSYNASDSASTGLPVGSGAVPVVNFGTAGEIWLPLGTDGLYHSTDFGSSWSKIGPSDLAVTIFSVGKAAPGHSNLALYLWGTTSNVTGLFRSDDAGDSWVRINDDAHQYGGPVLLQGDPRVYGRVYMGFFGRGIVYADITAKNNGSSVNVPGTFGI